MQTLQLTQEEAIEALVALRVLETNHLPPVRAVQVIAAHSAKDSLIFAILRNPATAGIETLNAWRIEGELAHREAVASGIRKNIEQRYEA